MKSQEQQSEKKPYTAPKLTVHGGVEQLTEVEGGGSAPVVSQARKG